MHPFTVHRWLSIIVQLSVAVSLVVVVPSKHDMCAILLSSPLLSLDFISSSQISFTHLHLFISYLLSLTFISSSSHHLLASQVIYGDTDSIMVHTGLTDVSQALAVGQRIKKEVTSATHA